MTGGRIALLLLSASLLIGGTEAIRCYVCDNTASGTLCQTTPGAVANGNIECVTGDHCYTSEIVAVVDGEEPSKCVSRLMLLAKQNQNQNVVKSMQSILFIFLIVWSQPHPAHPSTSSYTVQSIPTTRRALFFGLIKAVLSRSRRPSLPQTVLPSVTSYRTTSEPYPYKPLTYIID
jgi:hypothetical protein